MRYTGLRLILLVAVLSLPLAAYGQSLGQKAGHSKKTGAYTAHNKSRTAGHSVKPNQQGNLSNGHVDFHNKTYMSHRDYGHNYNAGYGGHYRGNNHDGQGYGKDRSRFKRHNNRYYDFYDPFYYGSVVYFGDSEPYGYYGYDTTLGTYPRRPSNIEVNRYLGEYNGGEEYAEPEYYAEPQYGPEEEIVYEPYDEQQAIYIFTDEYGVEHYVNDLELVPADYRDDVRVVTGY